MVDELISNFSRDGKAGNAVLQRSMAGSGLFAVSYFPSKIACIVQNSINVFSCTVSASCMNVQILSINNTAATINEI